MALATSDELMSSLVGKLYTILTGGDQNVPQQTDTFIAWCAPGIPFEAEHLKFARQGIAGSTPEAEEARELLAQASDFARLVNLIPNASGLYDKSQQQATFEQSGRTLSNIYSAVLQFSEVATGELSTEQKAKIEKFQGLLRTTKEDKNLVTDEITHVAVDGPVLDAYNRKMVEYLDAVVEYNAKRLGAMNSESAIAVQDWAMNAAVYRTKVKAAHDAWTSGGYRNEVDMMNAYIAQATQRDLVLLKAMLLEQFNQSRLTDLTNGQDFHFTSVVPAEFADNTKGWTLFEFSETDYNSYARTEHNAWSGSGGIGVGPFRASASVSSQSTSENYSLDTSDFKMSFMLTQVPISRPWFAPEFLENTAWRFAENTGMAPLSDGARPPQGQLVAFPTTAIFARDIFIDFAELHKTTSAFSSHISGGGSVSYGPFSLGGSYSRSVGEQRQSVETGEQGLKVNGMQIIGFKCHLLPKAPNPNPEVEAWS